MGVAFFSEAIGRLLAKYAQNSMPVYHVFSPLQYAGFAMMFFYFLNNAKTKKAIFFSLPFVILLGLLNTIYLQPLSQFPSNFLIVMFTILILFSMMTFKQLIEENQPAEQRNSVLYFTCGLLIYSVVVLLNFGLTNYFLRRDIDNKIGRDIVYYVTVLFYSLIGSLFSIDSKPHKAYEE